MGYQPRGQTYAGRTESAFFSDGMTIAFDRPCARIARSDTLAIRDPDGQLLEIIPAGPRPDGGVSVWYAPHPLLRHWLGWLERVDDTHWRLRMEPYHIDILRGIPALCADFG